LEHKSFRAYVSILYLNPKMQIYINEKKVQTRLLNKTLTKPFRYHYKASFFEKKAKIEVENAEKALLDGNKLNFSRQFNFIECTLIIFFFI
jgi:hypothetical protein